MNCSACFGQFHAHHQQLTTEWCDRRVWYSDVAAEGCQNWLAGSMSIEGFEAQLRVVLRIPQLCEPSLPLILPSILQLFPLHILTPTARSLP